MLRIERWTLLATALLLTGCAAQMPAPATHDAPEAMHDAPQAIYRSWTRSMEEEAPYGSSKVYRPSEWGFPPARFRERVAVNADGTCDWLVLHPADGHYTVSGRWWIDAGDEAIIHFAADGEESFSFRVGELTETLLRVEALPN